MEIKTVDQTTPTVVPQLKNGDKAINPYNGKDASIYQGGKVTGYTVSVPQEATAASPLSVQVKTDKQTEFKTLSKDNMKIILTEGTHASPCGQSTAPEMWAKRFSTKSRSTYRRPRHKNLPVKQSRMAPNRSRASQPM